MWQAFGYLPELFIYMMERNRLRFSPSLWTLYQLLCKEKDPKFKKRRQLWQAFGNLPELFIYDGEESVLPSKLPI